MTTTIYRQGDVLLIRTDEAPPASARVAPRTDGQIILALGEATGHRHCVRSKRATLLVDATDTSAEADTLWTRVTRILQITGQKAVDLRHEGAGGELTGEHGTVRLPPGSYRVIGQREWDGEQAQDAID